MSIERGVAPRLVAGRYELDARLGGGGMGDVYAATDRRLLRPVAVKLLRPDLARDDSIRRRFELEARAAARLSHPNIVTVFDSGEDDGTPYLVMERLPGRTFAQEMAQEPVGVARALEVTRAVLSALAAAHVAGILHRDVKPGNVLLTASGMPKVADFGIAKMVEPTDDADTSTLALSGELYATPAYLAPERRAGAPATPATDLYAVGVMLCEAVTGTRPAPGACLQLPDAIPRPVRDAVARATATDPARRFASADDMLAALDPGANVVPLAPRTAPPKLGRRPRRGVSVRVVFAILLVIVVVAAVVVGVVLAGGGDDETTVESPQTSVSSPLPAPLDRAIEQLEESVSR
jgi:serine/threonine protein kinase